MTASRKPDGAHEQPNGSWVGQYQGKVGYFTNEAAALAWVQDQHLTDHPPAVRQADGDPAED